MSILLTLALASPPSIDEPVRTGASAPGDFAVVIGIEDYAFLPDVPHALADARAWADFLLYTRGVPSARVVRLLGQPSGAQIRGALEKASETGPEGTVFVVFAGHGAAHSGTGEAMLMPVETPNDAEGFVASGMPLAELQELAGAGGAQVVVVTDACYSGAGRDGEQLIAGARFAVPSWATEPVGGSVTWRATAANELALPLDSVGHGAFTYAALLGLRGAADGERDGQPDGVVTGEEALLFTQRALRELGIESQQPQWDGPDDLVLARQLPESEPVQLAPPASIRSRPATVRRERSEAPRGRSVIAEAAFGTWTGLGVVHVHPGLLRRVGLEAGVGVGYMDYLSCSGATCQGAIANDRDVALEVAVLPYAHPLALHLALSPAKEGPWSQVDVGGSLGMGVAVHRDILGAHVSGGYTLQGRWTHGKRNLWVALGYAGAPGDLVAQTQEPYTWGATHSLLLNVGARLGTLWRARP